MNFSLKEIVLATLKCLMLAVLVSVVPLELEASELNTELTEREQQLLNRAEQKRQALELINMMQTLEKLIDYPDEVINELTGNTASQESLKRAIRALKKAREDEKKQLESAKAQQSQVGHPNQNPLQISKQTDSQVLKPILAISEQINGSVASQVIFKTPIGESISLHEGQSFSYNGESFKLLSVKPTSRNDSTNSKTSVFKISLKTSNRIDHYFWPAS